MLMNDYIKRSDMISCLLCKDAPCSNACEKCNPSDVLRSIWFDNQDVASLKLPIDNPCRDCDGGCEKACVAKDKVRIKNIMNILYDEVRPVTEIALPTDENRLKCDMCGVPLENPFILASSVIASTYDMCARAFEAGWAGISFKTICSLDIHEASPRFSAIKGADGSIIGFKNIEQLSDHSVAENMHIFRELKKNYPTKFILASIMGKDEAEWESLAKECEDNGADAIELNFSCPNMMEGGLGSDIGQVPELVEKFTRAAKRSTTIPVLAKLTPNVATMSPAAEAAFRGGADGIAAINTIKSVIGVSPYTFVSAPAVKGKSALGGYSGNAVKPIALRFIAELGQNKTINGLHISGMGGIETWRDSLEFILLGAGSIQVATAVMQYGYRIIDDLKAGLNYYLTQMGIASVKDIVGAGLESISSTTDVLERDTILFPTFDTNKCNGCGRCVISCDDGGHQAIKFENRIPKLDGRKCVGCHLCRLVCPENAISQSKKRIGL
ncbi:dihydropyrimidine dehydrogenase (NAD+) subunit PreA [Pseudobutyrivibrio sp. OR37]|uniref:NAD-dependent dihydropyrimidine dehydrogenase subunit PreA n=1 Tax=Pseudobutyrivibrio sp. OR37 TaxID=1798186 RepID=UPI0008E63BAD|nr:NAD-dependent dihydropyrimidine dehydrogenase subunit PreA [Pseudobutyrivibrio sp. OR37]SFI35230.1 dihydropyrimidine dehydrogenase (NAD+) subunit PreA [Pseudobutyrivibrio sp. OR37]